MKIQIENNKVKHIETDGIFLRFPVHKGYVYVTNTAMIYSSYEFPVQQDLLDFTLGAERLWERAHTSLIFKCLELGEGSFLVPLAPHAEEIGKFSLQNKPEYVEVAEECKPIVEEFTKGEGVEYYRYADRWTKMYYLLIEGYNDIVAMLALSPDTRMMR